MNNNIRNYNIKVIHKHNNSSPRGMKLKSGGVILRLVWPEFGIVEQNKTFLLPDIQRWIKFRFVRSHPVELQKEAMHTHFYAATRGCPKWGPTFYLLLFSLPYIVCMTANLVYLGFPKNVYAFPFPPCWCFFFIFYYSLTIPSTPYLLIIKIKQVNKLVLCCPLW